MLSSRLGKAPVVCATVPSVPPSAKMVRGASPATHGDEGAAGELEAGVGDRRRGRRGRRRCWWPPRRRRSRLRASRRRCPRRPPPGRCDPAGKAAAAPSVPPRVAVLGGVKPARGAGVEVGHVDRLVEIVAVAVVGDRERARAAAHRDGGEDRVGSSCRSRSPCCCWRWRRRRRGRSATPTTAHGSVPTGMVATVL